MAAANKFNDTVDYILQGVYDMRAAGDLMKVALTLTAPVATNGVLLDVTDIAAGDGYTAGGDDVQNGMTESSGTATVTGVDIVWTAAAGTFADFRYPVWYDDTPAATPTDPLVAWWDYGSTVDLGAGETFTFDITTNLATLV